jgi:hypothetical protein
VTAPPPANVRVYLLCDCGEKIEDPDAADGKACSVCGETEETRRFEARMTPVTEPTMLGQPEERPDSVLLVGHIVSRDAIPMALDFLASRPLGQDVEELGLAGEYSTDTVRRAPTGDGWIWSPHVELKVKLTWACQEDGDPSEQDWGTEWWLRTKDAAEPGYSAVTVVSWR